MSEFRSNGPKCGHNFRAYAFVICCLLILAAASPMKGGENPTAPAASGQPAGPVDVKITPGRIFNFQGPLNGKTLTGPYVSLRVSGAALAEAKGLRTLVKDAQDEAGNPLQQVKNTGDNFRSLNVTSRQPAQPPRFDEQFWLTAPGSVKVLKTMTGTIELVLPRMDPASVIAGSYAKDVGVPLKSAGVEITLLEPRTLSDSSGAVLFWELPYVVKDPQGKIIGAAEFFDAQGVKLKDEGYYGGGSKDMVTKATQFKSKPAADTVVKFYLVTDKSVVTVPFEFKDLPVSGR